MEYHAIEDAEAWHKIQDVLEERVKAGVEVRVFYDDMGSIGFINTDFVKKMESIGIHCRVFNPFVPGLNLFLNNRDHRKITVIDGKVGFTGGYNLANEYFNYTHPYGQWKDTGIRLEGDAVQSLTVTFLEMWNAVNWGYDNFRGIQEDIINSIGEGKDTLGLMPTGGGKSITFQVPALAKEGLCIVITPLISLMKDQVQNLKKRGIKALAIYSGMSRQEIIITLENCIFGNYKFLYISPERLDTEIFRTKLRKMNVSMITVDESHCISQWGYDFRPAYLKIAEIRDLLPGVPVLALTATATPEVVKDIQARLCFRQENVFRMSFERKNLAYIVRKTENKTASR